MKEREINSVSILLCSDIKGREFPILKLVSLRGAALAPAQWLEANQCVCVERDGNQTRNIARKSRQ